MADRATPRRDGRESRGRLWAWRTVSVAGLAIALQGSASWLAYAQQTPAAPPSTPAGLPTQPGVASPPSPADPAARVTELETERERLFDYAAGLEAERQKLAAALRLAESDLEARTAELAAAGAAGPALEARIGELETERERLFDYAAGLEAERQKLATALRLAEGDLADRTAELEAAHASTAAAEARAVALEDERERLFDHAAGLEAERQKLAAEIRLLGDRVQAQEAALAEAGAAIGVLEGERDRLFDYAGDVERGRQQAVAEVTQLQRASAATVAQLGQQEAELAALGLSLGQAQSELAAERGRIIGLEGDLEAERKARTEAEAAASRNAGERDALATRLATAEEERDRLFDHAAGLQRTADQAARDLAARSGELEAQGATLQGREAAIAELTGARDRLDGELQRMTGERDRALAERAAREGELRELTAAAQSQAGRLDELAARQNRLESELQSAVRRADAAEDKLARISAEVGEAVYNSLVSGEGGIQRAALQSQATRSTAPADAASGAPSGARSVFLDTGRVVLEGDLMFGTAAARLNGPRMAMLKEFAAALRTELLGLPQDQPWRLRVEGHTDDIPVGRGSRFANNWELSAARAGAVANFLIAEGLPAERIVVQGFADTRPRVPPVDAAARGQNRRVELLLTAR